MFENLFSRAGLSLDRLKTFCEIAEANSIARAVKGKTHGQSQYSRQLKELEGFCGTQLFERRGKALHITEAGKALFQLSKEYLTGLEAVVGNFSELPRKLSIGAGESLLHWLILPRFNDLESIFPNTHVELVNLRSKDINNSVLDGELDFGIVRQTACSSALGVCKLGILNYCLFVPKALQKKAKTSDPIELLTKLPLARLADDGEFNQILERLAKKKKIKLNTRLTCTSFPSMKEAVRRGFVAALLPSIAEADLPHSEFVKFDVDLFRVLNRPFVLCYNKRLAGVRGLEGPLLQRLTKALMLTASHV